MSVNNDIPNEVALAVKQMRKAAGLSQKELADLAQVGKTLIFEIEHGELRVSLSNLLKVLSVLNIKMKLITPLEVES